MSQRRPFDYGGGTIVATKEHRCLLHYTDPCPVGSPEELSFPTPLSSPAQGSPHPCPAPGQSF